MFAEDYEPDTRPMVNQMCSLCTHDMNDDFQYLWWATMAVAHLPCYDKVVSNAK